MSKTIDILENASSKKQHHESVNIQDEIARTYFHTPAKKHAGKKKLRWKPFLPWAIAILALLFAAAVLIFKSSIEVKVRFLGEIPSSPVSKDARKLNEDLENGLFFVESGVPNKDVVKNAYFMGDAKEFSAWKSQELVFCNSRGSGWANYTIELKEPIDLDKLDIRYTARGLRGDEFLTFVIVDSNSRSYRLEKDLSSAMSKEWQRYTINFRRFRKAVDLSNIAMIKFEFGSLTAGNYPSAVISLKDVYITKARRLKWL
ncbi:MAG: hypothetical protein Q8O01_07345 [Candidatus Omnitrophota bacterium]|nr:hypothetical protein [Candidatus Omnitrophota bacterium]